MIKLFFSIVSLIHCTVIIYLLYHLEQEVDFFFFANRLSLLEALLTSPHGLSYAHFLITGCIVAVTCPIYTTITGTVLTGVTRLAFC